MIKEKHLFNSLYFELRPEDALPKNILTCLRPSGNTNLNLHLVMFMILASSRVELFWENAAIFPV